MITWQDIYMEKMAQDFAPDFFVVGAAKAGTTALYYWLKQHPDVFLPSVKEPGFFAFDGEKATPANGPYDPAYAAEICTNADAYRALYHNAGSRLKGDISPAYLLSPNASGRIAFRRPDARIVIVLRDPVRRAFSQYMHHMRDGLEPCATFEEALQAEEHRLQNGWSWGHGYATHGYYRAQVARYLADFPRGQILFLEFEQLKKNPGECWGSLCHHLGLAPQPLPMNDRVNATEHLRVVTARPGISRKLSHPGILQTALKRVVPPRLRASLRPLLEGRGRPVPRLSEQTKARIATKYRQEREWLEENTGLDLSYWFV